MEMVVIAGEHESQKEFVITEHRNEIETKEGLKGRDSVKLI